VTNGLSEANREPDYTIDPVTGACNACACVGCSFGCMKEQRDLLAHLARNLIKEIDNGGFVQEAIDVLEQTMGRS
jgi:hypothetical protein